MRGEPTLGWPYVTAEVAAVGPGIQRHLAAHGVADVARREAMAQRIQARIQARLDGGPAGVDVAAVAVEETYRFIDDWLRQVFQQQPVAPTHDALRARAALLSGALTDWSAHWPLQDLAGLRARLVTLMAEPLPPEAPLAMPVARIELRGVGPIAFLRAVIERLLGHRRPRSP